ncbi:MAG: hypothetical protein IIX66_06160 [Alistipes sp.]|nr:hypothetical protein [Alistipes sp.]
MRRVVLIGSGNVAESLAQAIAAHPELSLIQLYARNAERGAEVATLAHCPHTANPEELDNTC